MRFFIPASLLAASATALPTRTEYSSNAAKRATPRIYLAGDSTMAKGGGGSGTDGWGQLLGSSLNAEVVNYARAGRSARSYTDEGRFRDIADAVVSGDIVVIEFGHNDGGSLSTTDNGRSDCYGSGDETCTTSDGTLVQTFPTYITNAGRLMTAKGATVIVSSPTPNNPWETGSFEYTPSRFVEYAQSAAAAIGSGASFVDHGQYVVNIYEILGADRVDAFFPEDHTHTSTAGATVVADAFVKGVACVQDRLANYVKYATSDIQGSCI